MTDDDGARRRPPAGRAVGLATAAVILLLAAGLIVIGVVGYRNANGPAPHAVSPAELVVPSTENRAVYVDSPNLAGVSCTATDQYGRSFRLPHRDGKHSAEDPDAPIVKGSRMARLNYWAVAELPANRGPVSIDCGRPATSASRRPNGPGGGPR